MNGDKGESVGNLVGKWEEKLGTECAFENISERFIL